MNLIQLLITGCSLTQFLKISIEGIKREVNTKLVKYITMQVLFDLLKTGNKFVLPRLNEFFPRTGIDHPKAVSRQ